MPYLFYRLSFLLATNFSEYTFSLKFMAAEIIVMMKYVELTSICGFWKKFSQLYNIGNSVVENRSRLLLNLDKIIRRNIRLSGLISIFLTKLKRKEE